MAIIFFMLRGIFLQHPSPMVVERIARPRLVIKLRPRRGKPDGGREMLRRKR
jgi:hypothetical protein